MRQLVSWLVYPVLMSAAMVATYIALISEYDPEITVAVINTTGTCAVIVLERVLPYRRAWNRSHGDLTTDIIHGVFGFLVIPFMLQLMLLSALYSASAWLTGTLGIGLWPHSWPLYAQAIFALVVVEFNQYWTHRAMHEIPLMWRVHATHHSAPRLYWLNVSRIHPLEIVMTFSITVLFLALLGASEAVLSLYLVFALVHSAVQHSNVRVTSGPLLWIFSQAEAHRWHHARDSREGNNNYGTVLLIYDVLFGSRFVPKDREPPEDIGLADMPDFPTGYLGQLWSPIAWPRFAPNTPAVSSVPFKSKSPQPDEASVRGRPRA